MKLPKGRKAIMLLGLPLGLAGAGGFGYMQFMSAPAEKPDNKPKAGEYGPMLALDERVINLAAGGSYKYAKIGVTIELLPEDPAFYKLAGEARAKAEEEANAAKSASVPVLLDAVGNVVAAQNGTLLNTEEGRAELKDELLKQAKEILGEEEVLDLFLTNFVMQ